MGLNAHLLWETCGESEVNTFVFHLRTEKKVKTHHKFSGFWIPLSFQLSAEVTGFGKNKVYLLN
jgi:hypothetical protein